MSLLFLALVLAAPLAVWWVERRSPGAAFRWFFGVFAAALGVWLLAGLAPLVARASEPLHDRLHRLGGEAGATVLEVEDGALRPREIRVPPHVDAPLKLIVRDRGAHSLTVAALPCAAYAGDEESYGVEVYASEPFEGPGFREFSVGRLDAGRYHVWVTPETGDDGPVCPPASLSGLIDVAQAPAVSLSLWRRVAVRIANASHSGQSVGLGALDYLFSAVNIALVAILVRRRSRDRSAQFLCIGMIGTGAVFNLQSHQSFEVIPAGELMFLLHTLFHLVSGISYAYAVILFPDGRLVPRWRGPLTRWVRRALYIGGTFFFTVVGGSGAFFPHAAFFVIFFGLAIPAVGVVAQGYRYLRPAGPAEKAQALFLVRALAPAFLVGVAFVVASAVRGAGGGDGFVSPSGFESTVFHVFQPAFALIPITLFVGILRHHLWDIDYVVSRALVYGSLGGFIGGVYVVVVVLIGQAAGTGGRPDTALSILATGLVAVAFEPLRERLQRFANRVVYGARATPYEVMHGLSQRLSGALSLDEVLPGMAEAAAVGVGAVRSRVRLFLPEGGERSVGWPEGEDGGPHDHAIPVTHQGETVGEIAVALGPGEQIAPAEGRLLEALARQAGVAMQGIRLAEELRARLEEISERARQLARARRRIVTARVALRRRLEREIRDGVEVHLQEMAEAIGRAEAEMAGDAARAVETLDDVTARSNRALETLRGLASQLYPRVLADRGLVSALEAQVRKLPVAVHFQADPGLEGARFDPQVESAIYFCCVEALKNVVMHAPGADAELLLGLDDGWLAFHLSDDGPGFDPRSLPEDSVLQDMLERVGMLGGTFEVRSVPGRGTTVEGRVPAQPPAASPQASSSRSGEKADLGM